MSSQPSTLESVRVSAASATQTVAQTLDPSQDRGSSSTTSSSKNGSDGDSNNQSYKQKLDEAAYMYTPPGQEKEKKESLVEKVISYIPGMSSSQKSEPKPSAAEPKINEDANSEAIPLRPEHDLQVEQFLRGQYKSKSGADLPDVKEGK